MRAPLAGLAPGSVRARITAAAVAVVGTALVVAGVVLVAALRWSLTDDVRNAARLRAQDVAHLLAAGAPVGGLPAGDPEDLFVQVVDGAGAVVASSANVSGLPPIADVPADGTATIHDPPIDDDEFVVVAAPATTPDGAVKILVGQTLETVTEATSVLVRALLAGLPLVLGVVGLTAWHLVGRALAPVEAIRAEVDGITGTDLSRRVPSPGTADEISRLADTMNRMLGRVEAAVERQRRFVSDASHELRSPIAALAQNADVALSHPQRLDARELAETVHAEAGRLDTLVRDLLWLAQADEGALEPALRPVDLDDVVLDEARRLAATGVRVDTSRVSAGQVVGDVRQLRHLLRNLIDNARRHARSRVSLELAEAAAEVVLRVDDDGPGIAVADRDRVLERFVRLDEARTRDAGGSGLGLAIVGQIAAAHGGSVSVADSHLGGARFEVRLPRGTASRDQRFSAGSAPPSYGAGIENEEPAGGQR